MELLNRLYFIVIWFFLLNISASTYIFAMFSECYDIALSPNSKYLLLKNKNVLSSKRTITLIELSNNKTIKNFNNALKAQFSEDGEYLIVRKTIHEIQKVSLYNIALQKRIITLSESEYGSSYDTEKYIFNNNYLAYKNIWSVIKIFDIRSGERLDKFNLENARADVIKYETGFLITYISINSNTLCHEIWKPTIL